MVFLNGFFVLAEYGLVRARRAKLEELAETGETLKAGLSGGAVLDGDGHLLGFVSDCAVPGEE